MLAGAPVEIIRITDRPVWKGSGTFAKDDEEGRAKAVELDLTGVAERIQQPYLAITGRLDRLIPWEQTERGAKEAPNGEFLLHEDGNHGCANVPYKTRPLAADWLRERLG